MPWVLEEIDQVNTGHGSPSPVHLRFVAPPPPRSPTTGERPVLLRLPTQGSENSVVSSSRQSWPTSKAAQEPERCSIGSGCSFLPVTPRHRRYLGISPRNRLSSRFHRKCGSDQTCDHRKPPSPHLEPKTSPMAIRTSHLNCNSVTPLSAPRRRSLSDGVSPSRNPHIGPRPSPSPGVRLRRPVDLDWLSRKAALESLGSLVTGGPSPAPAVAAASFSSPRAAAAADSLSQRVARARSAPRLISPSRAAAATAAATGLDAADSPPAACTSAAASARRLVDRMEHPALEVRLAAAAALRQAASRGGLAAAAAVEGLARLLRRHPDWLVRESAMDALPQVAGPGDPAALEGLLAALRDSDWRVREVGLEGLVPLVDRSLPSVIFAVRCLSPPPPPALPRRANSIPAPLAGTAGGVDSAAAAAAAAGDAFAGRLMDRLAAALAAPATLACQACRGPSAAAAAAGADSDGLDAQPRAGEGDESGGGGDGGGGGGWRSTTSGEAPLAAAGGGGEEAGWAPQGRGGFCGACAARLCGWARGRVAAGHWAALAMGAHPRLGRRSPLQTLDPALLPHLADACFAP